MTVCSLCCAVFRRCVLSCSRVMVGIPRMRSGLPSLRGVVLLFPLTNGVLFYFCFFLTLDSWSSEIRFLCVCVCFNTMHSRGNSQTRVRVTLEQGLQTLSCTDRGREAASIDFTIYVIADG